MDDESFSISGDELFARFAAGRGTTLLDVRREADFAADERMIAGALRIAPERLDDWTGPEPGAEVVVYCVHGHRVSQEAAQALRARGLAARHLAGGIADWQAARRPTIGRARGARNPGDAPTRWVTRARPKIDRIACPWLIRRFLDASAEILYVAPGEVLACAERSGAVPFDVPDVTFSHHGERCSFDAFIAHYGIDDPALERLAAIVRGADTARPDLAPQCAGLLAVSLGLCDNFQDDAELLERGLVLYDALYAWSARLQDERHGWPPAA